jgi:hypothetical protein
MTFAARSLTICWRIGWSGRSRFVKECLLYRVYRDGVESNAGYVQARVMRSDQASGIVLLTELPKPVGGHQRLGASIHICQLCRASAPLRQSARLVQGPLRSIRLVMVVTAG